jgi:hypothetical protein
VGIKAPTESALLAQVRQWLTLKRVFHWRANSGGGTRGGRPIKGNPAGTPDLLAVLPGGRLCGIELKSKAGRLRPAQAAWFANATRAGALCLIVRDLRELIDAFAKEGVTC